MEGGWSNGSPTVKRMGQQTILLIRCLAGKPLSGHLPTCPKVVTKLGRDLGIRGALLPRATIHLTGWIE